MSRFPKPDPAPDTPLKSDGETVSGADPLPTGDENVMLLLSALLDEQKKTNCYLAEMLGDSFKESDNED